MLIDIHCHILPCIDDGPSNFSAFIEMSNQAVEARITDVFATPHHRNGQFENDKNDILKSILEFNNHLQQLDIPLTIHPGQELRIHRDIFHSLDRDEILTLGNKGMYLLVELPSIEVPSYTIEVVYELLLKGITPIIVHPERNKQLINNPDFLFELVQEGALTQLTAGSIIGHFGKRIKSFSEKIIEHQMVHFIATDAHGTKSRNFFLREAYEAVTKNFGTGYSNYYRKNAELLINGCVIQKEEPSQIRRKILGLF